MSQSQGCCQTNYTVQYKYSNPVPQVKNYPAQNVKSAEVENPDAKTSPSYKLKTAICRAGSLQKVSFREKVMRSAWWGFYKSRYHYFKSRVSNLNKHQIAILSLPAAYYTKTSTFHCRNKMNLNTEPVKPCMYSFLKSQFIIVRKAKHIRKEY